MSRRGELRPLSVAPMMDRTDRHYRYFMRKITHHTLLYTEMITTGAIIHGDRQRLLGFDPSEHPLALQVGGDNPLELAECAKIAEDWGYDEINLNVGCPSDRVQSGNFGACLMRTPQTVADGVAAMRAVTSIPVTVKHRIGVDELDRYEDMAHFVEVVSQSGCVRFSVHARKAWLKGLSPKQNRNVPPLRYAEVHRLKREFPHLDIELNGGIKTMDQSTEQLNHVDAVMIGRAAYSNPYEFVTADQRFFNDHHPILSRMEVFESMLPYIEAQLAQGKRLMTLTRHMLQLFSHARGAKHFKRVIGTAAAKGQSDLNPLRELVKDPMFHSAEPS